MDWFPWYRELYRADTLHLTLAEDGAYRRLIDEYMTLRQPLPNNPRALARLLGVSLEEWLAVSENVLSFFKQDGGVLRHKRCDKELDAQDARAKKRSERAQKAAEKRWGKQQDKCYEHARSNANAMLGDATRQDKTVEVREVETRKKEINQFIKQAATGLRSNRTEMSADERRSRWLSKVYHFIAGVTGNPDRAAAIVDRWHGGDPWAKDLVEKVDKCRKAGDKRGALELIEGRAA